MNPINTEIKFEKFIWIDICQPDKTRLDEIAKIYNLDYFQIKDSLEVGHLPKFEKQKNYNFLILRSFTSHLIDKETNVNDISNKIAFFYNDKKLITVHRAKFDFLQKIQKTECTFNDSEDLLMNIIHNMIETYNQPIKILNDKNDNFEKTIFLKNAVKISLEDLYFQKTQSRITKKLL